jgi:arylsulfatase A-like enzyme
MGRSGDFFVVLKKDVTPIADTTRYVATHGSLWDYDRRVPILFWRPGTSGTTIENSAETTDIMPTLASMIGVPVQPGSVDGHCLADVPGAHCAIR